MKLIISFLIILGAVSVNAKTLLIPEQNASFEDYLKTCQKSDYICTTDFFSKTEIEKPTPLLDSFLDSIDFNNAQFTNSAFAKIKKILESEMISAEQLELLVRVLEQLDSELKKPSSSQLLQELKYLSQNIKNLSPAQMDEADMVVFFKKTVSVKSYSLMKKTYLKVPAYEISFNMFPSSERLKIPLVQGHCESAKLNENLQIETWKLFSEKPCNWTAAWTENKSHTKEWFVKNKNWLFVGAALIGTALIASQYEFQMSF